MDPFPTDFFDFFGPIFFISLLVPLVIVGVVIVVIVWSIRRTIPPQEDPAVSELKSRLARGEIDPVEYEVRMRALRDGDA